MAVLGVADAFKTAFDEYPGDVFLHLRGLFTASFPQFGSAF